MSIGSSLRAWAARSAQGANAPASTSGGPFDRIWHWLNAVSSGVSHIIGTDLLGVVKAAFGWDKFAGHVYETVAKGIVNAVAWLLRGAIRALESRFDKIIDQLRAKEHKDYLYLRKLAFELFRFAVGIATVLVGRERKARMRADVLLDHEIKTRIRWLHQAIEREALSGYKTGKSAQLDTITGMADLIANLNPVTRTLVKDLVKGILDLAIIDDPVARIALGFVLRHVIDRLGLDKPIGHLLAGLLNSVLGAGQPHNLHDVIADICTRLAAGEAEWAQFMTSGGSEVEQAGTEWQKITDLGTDALILAFLGAAVAAPQTWARDVGGSLGAVVNDTIGAVSHLIRSA